MNRQRVAALLRELADAIEADEPARPRKRPIVKVDKEPDPEKVAGVRRSLRRRGVAA